MNPSYRPSSLEKCSDKPRVPPFAGSDLVVNPSRWSSHVVGNGNTFSLCLLFLISSSSRLFVVTRLDSLNEFFLPAQLRVGNISSWIDLDSDDLDVQIDSETTLKQEIAWASHLSLQVELATFFFFFARNRPTELN